MRCAETGIAENEQALARLIPFLGQRLKRHIAEEPARGFAIILYKDLVFIIGLAGLIDGRDESDCLIIGRQSNICL